MKITQHLTLRVAWHDSKWNGRVCAAPSANSYCVMLDRVRQERDDVQEDAIHGTDWSELAADQRALDEEGNVSTEDLLNHLMESRKMLSNASYFSLTATPKNKTVETFGRRSVGGEFQPFHTYSIEQAIKEEFILDVL